MLALAGCDASVAPVDCPNPPSVAPRAIGGTAYVNSLTARLAVPDLEKTISEAITEMRKKEPTLGADMMTNVLIAAECET